MFRADYCEVLQTNSNRKEKQNEESFIKKTQLVVVGALMLSLSVTPIFHIMNASAEDLPKTINIGSRATGSSGHLIDNGIA